MPAIFISTLKNPLKIALYKGDIMVTITYTKTMGTPPIDQPFYGANPIQAIARFFRKYAVFSGRASRSEFWWAYLITSIVNFLLIGLEYLVPHPALQIASGIFSYAVLVPTLSVACRRLHDVNKSGKWLYILCGGSFFCVFLALVLFIAANQGTQTQQNESIGKLSISVFMFGVAVLGTILFSLIVTLIALLTRESDPAGIRFDKIVRMTGPSYGNQFVTSPGTVTNNTSYFNLPPERTNAASPVIPPLTTSYTK
ncbi:DUF805 domain-containing protein [Alloscardovia theropitheci]|uniref:DUF805 domain-containing protein n=1 Tax=Alloscardovia theropitheci TaxID=2496842 RepID=A0A4R0QPJ2_9BIFI|nr:DUF805 domain-containing protein [Alloscardovia theropitheci]TCD54143.1 DUF805 domain-containing protein [Alloscardovia theropitheci]